MDLPKLCRLSFPHAFTSVPYKDDLIRAGQYLCVGFLAPQIMMNRITSILYKHVESVPYLQVSYLSYNKEDKQLRFGRVWWALKKSVKVLDAYSGLTSAVYRLDVLSRT